VEAGPDPSRPHYLVILAKCHGKESYFRADFATGISPDMFGMVMSTGKFFAEDDQHETDASAR
jgi:hypothetical protein